MSQRTPSVILADDHPMMLAGLCALLEPTLDVVAMATDGEALVEAGTRLRPDLVIADIAMPNVDGIEATRRMRTLSPPTKVVILSCHGEASWVQAAFEAGARAYLSKAAAPAEIEGAIREVLAGHFYVSPSLTRALLFPATPEAPRVETAEEERLTPREQLISKLVSQGLHNKEIAHRLGVSVATVRTHLSNVYTKLGGVSRIELALQAARSAGALG